VSLRAESSERSNPKYSKEREITISSKPLETSSFTVANIKFDYVIYDGGLAINLMYTINDPVGFKLSDGMDIPAELAEKFKFAKMKSKLPAPSAVLFLLLRGSIGSGSTSSFFSFGKVIIPAFLSGKMLFRIRVTFLSSYYTFSN